MLPLRRPRLTRRLSRPVSSAPVILPAREAEGVWGKGFPQDRGVTGGRPPGGNTASAGAAQAALGQVALEAGPARRHRDEAVLGPDGGQHGQVALDLAPDPAERDAEHALS